MKLIRFFILPTRLLFTWNIQSRKSYSNIRWAESFLLIWKQTKPKFCLKTSLFLTESCMSKVQDQSSFLSWLSTESSDFLLMDKEKVKLKQFLTTFSAMLTISNSMTQDSCLSEFLVSVTIPFSLYTQNQISENGLFMLRKKFSIC